jgi:hypothetical protein
VKLFSISICSLFLAVSAAACGGDLPVSTQAQQGKAAAVPVTDYASLIDKLRAAGVSVEPAGEVEQPFLSITGKMIKLYGEDVQVFQYANTAAADGEAAPISRDGMAVGTRKIFWVGAPHFFKQGRLLVLYVGNNDKVLRSLEVVLGRQFAGQ